MGEKAMGFCCVTSLATSKMKSSTLFCSHSHFLLKKNKEGLPFFVLNATKHIHLLKIVSIVNKIS